VKNIIKLFLLLISIITISISSQIDLTDKEKEWIKNNPTIKVQSMVDSVPYNYIQDGKPQGYALANIKLIASKVGLKVEMIQGYSWSESMELLKNGKIDIMPNMVKTKPREEHYAFTSPYTPIMNVMYVKDGNFHPKSLNDLDGKTLAVAKGFSEVPLLQKHYPNIKLHFTKNGTEAFKLLSLGKVDATSYSLGAGNKIILKNALLNVVPAFEIKDEIFQKYLHMATNKNNTILRDILEKGLNTRTDKEKNELRKKWLLNQLKQPNEDSIKFTEEEKKWINSKLIIKVHNESNWPPFNYAQNGKPMGYSIDYMNLIAKKTGLKVEYITGPTWNQFLDMMKDKSLDVMLNIVKTPDRQKYLLYTPPYADNPNAILSKKDTPYPSIESLYDKTVALPKGFFTEEILRKNYPQIKLLLVSNVLEAMKAVIFGKADAALGELAVFNHLLSEHMMTNLSVSGEAKMGNPEFSLLNIATRKDLPVLQSILIKGLESVTLEEKKELQKKWLGNNTLKPVNSVTFTNEEKSYLSKKDAIKICVDPDWLPFEKIDENGKYKGVGSDIINIISSKLDKPIVLNPTTSWNETIKSFKNKKCDIIPMATKTPSREEYMDFTKPYIEKPLVVATKEDKFFIQDSSDLKNKKVGIVKGYAFIELLKEKQPNINIINVKNIKDGLRKVQDGEIFGFIDALPAIAYIIQKDALVDLKIAGRLEFDVELSIASHKNEHILNSIMQKALDDIEKEQVDSIVGKWIAIKIEQSFDYKILIYLVAVFLIILVFVLYRHYSVRKMNKQLEKISITDALTNIYNRRYFNEIFPKVINSAKRKNELVSFIIMDIDHFKQYNDTYGHQMGDEVLRKVAKTIKDSLHRADDYCFRLGGEEFGVIFKSDAKEKASEFANIIRENIENLHINHSGNSASSYVTVSMGLICKQANDIKDDDEVYKQGDDLLYKAKESGRNKVVLD
jgi:polar amino acid transport system substrate-binding protein